MNATSRPRGQGYLSGEIIVIIALIVTTTFVAMVNETALSVALPAIMEEFSVSASVVQWLLTGVMLTIAIMMPATGWLLDRFSTRTVYFASVAFLVVGFVVSASSPTFAVLLGGRILQAIGTAMLMPLQMTVVMTVVPVQVRGTVMGIVGIVMAVGPALGPTFSGAIMAVSTWHTTFWIMSVALVIVAIVAAMKLRNVGENKSTPLDVLSLILSAFAFGGLVYALGSVGAIISGAPESTIAWATLVVGIVGLVLFVWRQKALAHKGTALLDLTPLKIPNFVVSVAAIFLFQVGTLGMVNTLPLYMQGALLSTALVAGLVSLLGGLVETVLSPIGGALFDRIGPRPIVIPAAIVATASMLWASTVDHTTPVWTIVVIYMLFGVAMALTFTPIMTTALGSLPREIYSHGSAIYGTAIQLSAAAGTAVMIAIYDIVSAAGGGTQEAQGEAGAAVFLATAICMAGTLFFTLFIKRPAATDEFTHVEVNGRVDK